MKILYDHQIFACQIYGGISRYFFELMNRFSQVGEPDFELSLWYSKNHYLNRASSQGYSNFFKNCRFRFRLRKRSIVNKTGSQKMLSQQRFDIFHPTYYDPYFLKYIKDKPFVLTILDMTHEIFPDKFRIEDRTSEHKRLLAQKASKIITVSESTKKDIVRFYDIDEKKIAVTYLANSLSKVQAPRRDFAIPERYLLFVGGRGVYKNFEFFIKAISPLMNDDEDLNVICAGGKPFSASEKDVFKVFGLEERIHHFVGTDEVMAWFYQNALAFVYPSLYEGFGIPVLEAFSCGCPAILSNKGSLPEVGGYAAVYFDPRSEVSVREAVSQVIYNEELRRDLRTKGLKRLEKFSWKITAAETNAVYRSIL